MDNSFDPGAAGLQNGKIFGFPYSEEEAKVIIIPVPWDVTTSFRDGTSAGPEAILQASPQLDFHDSDFPNAWKNGVFMRPVSGHWKEKNKELRRSAVKYINALEEGLEVQNDKNLSLIPEEINRSGKALNEWVKEQCEEVLQKGKLPCVVGGDHSSPLGLMQALSEKHGEYGILQIDAHADLREAYEGFHYSHASIMYNALKIPKVKKLLQVGVRDLSPAEAKTIESDSRISCFFDEKLKREQYRGKTWEEQVKDIIRELPEQVYISYDIDGLHPSLCPGTGTPVPGGFQKEEIDFLLTQLHLSGKKIIGFDLCEVSPAQGEWDANVGARVLFKLCNILYASSS